MLRLDASDLPQKVTPFTSTREQCPKAIKRAYPPISSKFQPLTTVKRATVRCPFRFKQDSEDLSLSHASRNNGRSIASKLSGVEASTLTYYCCAAQRYDDVEIDK